jgi:hypothetical protein
MLGYRVRNDGYQATVDLLPPARRVQFDRGLPAAGDGFYEQVQDRLVRPPTGNIPPRTDCCFRRHSTRFYHWTQRLLREWQAFWRTAS